MNINRLVSLAALVVWTFAATTTGTAGEQDGAVDEALAAMDAEPTTTVTAFEAALDAIACENWCSSGCDCDKCGCDGWSLFGTNFRSDRAFEGFIEPVSSPVFSADPRSRTRLRLTLINQMIPEDNPVLQGGDFQLYAPLLTVALNERFSLVLQKGGYIEKQFNAQPNAEGWADFGTGFKYVFVRDTCNQFLLSGGIFYEWSQGSSDVFQGNGDGVWNFFLTSGKQIGCKSHVIGSVAWHLPNNGSDESQSLFYSLHLDREIANGLYVLWEINGIHYLESGRALPGVDFEGGDLINLGAGDVAGNHFFSMAFGGTYRFSPHVEFMAAWEFPLTGTQDIMDNRTTASLSLIY